MKIEGSNLEKYYVLIADQRSSSSIILKAFKFFVIDFQKLDFQELATLTKEHPGNTELYFRVTDDIDVNRMAVDLISRPVKLSVGRELITYLKDRPELGFRIN